MDGKDFWVFGMTPSAEGNHNPPPNVWQTKILIADPYKEDLSMIFISSSLGENGQIRRRDEEGEGTSGTTLKYLPDTGNINYKLVCLVK